MAHALAGRTAVVTGASRGIGLACAQQLIEAGARVALLARGSAELQRQARALGGSAVALDCDVTRPDDVATAVRAVHEQFGAEPDILVNNAGYFALASAERTSPEMFARTVGVNLVAPFQFVHALLPGMKARGSGHLVMIGSIADHLAFADNSAYAASKYGLRGLHEVLRAELRGTGVRTTLVSPGPVDTALWDAVIPQGHTGLTPRHEMLTADAVAAAVLYAVTQPVSVNVDEVRVSHA